MRDEVGRQEEVLDRVTGHVDRTQTGLTDVQHSAEKTLGKKGGLSRHSRSPFTGFSSP